MLDHPIPDAFATSVIGLGAAKAYFPVKAFNRTGSLVACLIFLCGSFVVLLYSLYLVYTAYLHLGLGTVGNKLVAPMLIALLAFLIGLASGWTAYTNWNNAVAVYERGFATRARQGIHLWSWDEIVSLTESITRHYTNGVYTGTTHVYTLFNRQNERLVLNDKYSKVVDLAKIIRDNIFPILYESAAKQYNAGQLLSFGPVEISKSGIQMGKKTYPWSEVQQVSIHRGFLKVSKKDGGWFSGASASAGTIPNLEVLLSIIHQVVGFKTG